MLAKLTHDSNAGFRTQQSLSKVHAERPMFGPQARSLRIGAVQSIQAMPLFFNTMAQFGHSKPAPAYVAISGRTPWQQHRQSASS